MKTVFQNYPKNSPKKYTRKKHQYLKTQEKTPKQKTPIFENRQKKHPKKTPIFDIYQKNTQKKKRPTKITTGH